MLLRNKKDSKNPDYYVDFGTSYKEGDPCILYSAARSFIKKSGGLLCENEIGSLDNPDDVLMILKDQCQRNNLDLYTNPKIKQILTNFVHNQSHVIFETVCEEHLAIFYPMPYYELEAINCVMA